MSLSACPLVTHSAVHLELVFDMTTAEFLLSLRRFIARRGVPAFIVFDNAKQFQLAASTLERLFSMASTDQDIAAFSARHGIIWHFIPEHAPWMGGHYERLVGTVKRALHKSIGSLHLPKQHLLTVLQEVEAVVNSPPLTYVSSDNTDYDCLIFTPAHFLVGQPLTALPYPPCDDDTTYRPTATEASSTHLLQLWKKAMHVWTPSGELGSVTTYSVSGNALLFSAQLPVPRAHPV